MVRNRLTAMVLVAGALAVAARSPTDRNRATPWTAPSVPRSRIRSGDLVFRIGLGWRADAVRALSRDAFSHVGVAVVERNGVHVVHAAPPGDGGPGGVVDQTLDAFSAPAEARGVAVFRRTDVDAGYGRRMAARALAWAAARVPFDDRFDMADARAFYCTELVLRGAAAAGSPISVHATTIGGLLGGRYVLPSDLLRSNDFRQLVGS